MIKKIYMKFIKTILSNLLFLFFIFNQQALSKPIPPGSGEGDVPANILILLDSSASMQRQIVTGDSLGFPHSIAADSNGDVYIGESSNGIVKMISADEKADQTLMSLCTAMANRPLGELGSILIATRDSDFALVARAIEERFGFGVIANSRNLNSWI